MRPELCAPCGTAGRKGYCAPGRCYCGHTDCPAFASFVDVRALPVPDVAPTKTTGRQKSSWDNREGETWIDQL